MADSDLPPPISEQELAPIKAALDTFGQKMRSSNLRFLHQQAEVLKALEQDELKRLERMYTFVCMHIREEHWMAQPSLDAAIAAVPGLVGHVIADDSNTGVGNALEGIRPPAFITPRHGQLYLKAWEIVIAEWRAKTGDHDDIDIPPPRELAAFYHLTAGIADPDFRRDNILDYGLELPFVGPGETDDEIITIFAESIKEMLDHSDDKCQNDFSRGRWLEVKINLYQTASLGWWYKHCIYCRAVPGRPKAYSHIGTEWAWRPLLDTDDLWGRYFPGTEKMLHNSIPEFLEWYSSWEDWCDPAQSAYTPLENAERVYQYGFELLEGLQILYFSHPSSELFG